MSDFFVPMFTLFRLLTFIPLTVIIVIMADNIWHRRYMNGLTPTRNALLLLFISIWFNIVAYLIAGLHAFFIGEKTITYHGILAKLDWLLLLSRVFSFLAVVRFYKLIKSEGGQHGDTTRE